MELSAKTQDKEKSYHPKNEHRISCSICWLKTLRGHVRYDLTPDVMLPKSLIGRPNWKN